MAHQLQLVSLWVLVEVFSEPVMACGVEGKGEGVTWRRGNPNKQDDVWVRELAAYQDLSAVSLD